MAKTEYVFLQGKAMWCRPHMVDKFGNWKTGIYLTPESVDIVKGLQVRGLKNVLSLHEDGYYMQFNRPQQKNYGGKVIGLVPPEVLDRDGKPMREILIGNGSDITLKLEVYGFKKFPGIAARWMAVKVDNLVPFVPPKDFTEDEEKATRGLTEQVAQPAF